MSSSNTLTPVEWREILVEKFTELVDCGFLCSKTYGIDVVAVGHIVSHYCDDLRIFKTRFGMDESKLTVPKVAGLMISAIMKFRPICVIDVSKINTQNKDYSNPIFAIMIAESICLSLDPDKQIDFDDCTPHIAWMAEYTAFLQSRNYTTESNIREILGYCRRNFLIA